MGSGRTLKQAYLNSPLLAVFRYTHNKVRPDPVLGLLRNDVFFVTLLDLVSAYVDNPYLPGRSDDIVIRVIGVKLGCQLGSYRAYLR